LQADRSVIKYANIRNLQLKAYERLFGNNVGMVVTIDTTKSRQETGTDPLHPRNKKAVGERLALYALGSAYGKNVQFLSPIYESMTVTGNQVTVTMKNVYSGLESRGGSLNPRHFAVAGSDGQWYPADSVTISGTNKLIISSGNVPNPKKVSYFQENDWDVNWNVPFVGLSVHLYNSAGLPASPFKAEIP
jgi:sialate O-acetylesterase